MRLATSLSTVLNNSGEMFLPYVETNTARPFSDACLSWRLFWRKKSERALIVSSRIVFRSTASGELAIAMTACTDVRRVISL